MARKQRKLPWLDWRNGVAYAFWYDQDKGRTERLSLHTTDPVKAQNSFAAFLTQGKELREPARLAGLTVAHALDDYFSEHVSKKVIDTGRQEIAINHLKAWFKGLLKDVDIDACEAYASARRAGTVSGGKIRKAVSDPTIRRELQVISAAANHAMRRKRIKRDELPIVELPPDSDVSAIDENDWLTKDELLYAIAGADPLLRDLMALAYGSAGRKASIEDATRFQVDLKRGLFNLRRPDETDLQRRSKKRRPIVPISAAMRAVLERRCAEPFENGRLFPVGTDFYHRMKNHMASIGLAHKSNPHILRHSRATHLLMDRASIYDVAKLLGDTVATVERVYGHYCPEYLGKALNRDAVGE